MKFKQFLNESVAHDQAKTLGLEYYGFGRYGKNHIVTHIAHAGRLIPVSKQFHKNKGEDTLLHYEHAEDQMFNKGVAGARQTLDTLHSAVKNPENLETQTKIDGCVHKDTIIMTNKGDMKISDLAGPFDDIAWQPTTVMGHNFETGLDEMVNIEDWMKANGSKQWVEVFFENGSSLKMTEDHEVYTENRGWIPAGQLTEDDNVREI